MLEGMVTEGELLKLMGLKDTELSYLRHAKGLPYVRLSSRKRVYLECDLMDWFKENRSQMPPESGKPPSDERRSAQEDDRTLDTDVER
jgi:hypothetical protein